jgi:chemotaxis protein CheY-P-specific phosphatase CheC/ActR/RegA family two-component response regulator
LDQRAIIDVICKTGIENLATEIGALLGRELRCDDIQLTLSCKETIFKDLDRPATTLTRMTISGDKDGDCYLLTRLDAAVILGGTLIMLPEDMIEEHIQSGELDGELNDAFGEVANIIAGVFTQAFVDKYSKTLRFIKKTVEELAAPKIDLVSDEPFPPGNYYVTSCKLIDGENNLGPIEFIVPAAAFELETEVVEAPEAAEPSAEKAPAAAPANEPEPTAPAVAEEALTTAEPPVAPKPAFADAKKLTDVVFNATIGQISEEIGALLGQDLVCDDIQLLMTNKADFFANHCTDKVTMANMQVSGDRTGCGHMFTRVPSAVILGGTLIMLPEDQIEEQASKLELEGEVEDAFGEVANILAGGLTQVFLDRYPQQLRFVRTESSLVVPTKIDMASDAPFPEGDYYLASFAVSMGEQDLDRIQLLFPAHIFDLDNHQQTAPATTAATPAETAAEAQPATATAHETTASGAAQTAASPGAQAAAEFAAATTQPPATTAGTGPPLVLVISEDPENAQPFSGVLTTAGYDCKIVSFQEDIKSYFQQNQVLGAVLIMSQVNEKGFAAAIKLQSAGQALPPLIFCGPEWTRSTVLRAVKYGAQDILIMPASGDEIEEKIIQHFRKAS